MKLLTNQEIGISKLSSYKVGALFMEPGTGKTRTAVELIRSVQGIDLVVWLTPFQTKSNLQKEISKCGGVGYVEICGIESLSASDRIYLDILTKIQAACNFRTWYV